MSCQNVICQTLICQVLTLLLPICQLFSYVPDGQCDPGLFDDMSLKVSTSFLRIGITTRLVHDFHDFHPIFKFRLTKS